MMKFKDFCCLLGGIILLALAFQIRGFAEENVQDKALHTMRECTEIIALWNQK